MRPVVRTLVIGVATILVRVPGVIQKLIGQPVFGSAVIDQAEGKFIRAADVAQVIEIFIGPANGPQVLAPGRQASTIVGVVDLVGTVVQPQGNVALPVDGSLLHDLLDARIIERVKGGIGVADFIEMNHGIGFLGESLEQALQENGTEDRIRVANDADISLGRQQAHVVHAVLVVHIIAGITQHNPFIQEGVTTWTRGDHPVQIFRFPLVEFHPDQLIIPAIHALAIEVVQAVEALADAPVDEDDTDSGAAGIVVAKDLGLAVRDEG
jgi:hypothetical protein